MAASGAHRSRRARRAIYESLKGDGSYLVLADALLERGDVRGELIHVQHALRQKADDTLREREKQLLSRLELLDPSLHALKLEWRLGFLKSATDAPNLAGIMVEKTLMAPEIAKGLQQAGFELMGTPVASRREEYRFVATME